MLRSISSGVLSLALFALAALLVGSCSRSDNKPVASADSTGAAPAGKAAPVVVYTSVDEEFARQVLDSYTAASGVALSVVFDSEAGKTTGLVQKIQAEGGRARGDVFWSSELFNTILLAREGLLAAYDSPNAADVPARYRDAAHLWTATGLRGRVLAFDPKVTKAEELPGSWEDLSKAQFAGSLAIANPLFGTTRGHVAALFAVWGRERGRAWLSGLREGGAMMVDGNSAAVRAVGGGRVRWCATDTDDVWVAQRAGESRELRYLDLGDGGTLLIPCSVAILKGCPNEAGARRLVDYLVSADVERMLARSESRNIPVREALRTELGMELPPQSAVSYDAVADAMGESLRAVREILIR